MISRILLLGFISSFLISCSTLNSSQFRAPDLSARSGHDQGAPVAATIPLEDNAHVQKWVNYFKGRGRVHMRRYLERSSRYEKLMKSILKAHRVPEELFYIAMIESGFSATAHSHASAVGYWQFVRDTGKFYGLKISHHIDERRDPILATHAAAKYFKSLYHLFGSWPLAIASYNTGENRVKRLVMKHHTRNYWDLVRKKVLPAETRNYFPKYMAARWIAKNPEKYGFNELAYQAPFQYDEIIAQKPVSLSAFARHMKVTSKELKRLNPMYRRDYVPVRKGHAIRLRIPQSKKTVASLALAKSFAKPRKSQRPANVFYKVKRGDNLFAIARKFRTSIGKLQRTNNIKRRSVLKVGQILRIPSSTSKRVKKSSVLVHVVKRGDTLSRIAQMYKVSIASLKKRNKLRRGSRILAGAKLMIPR